MSNQLYPTLVLVGDGIYADIATCYLANQLQSFGIKVCRVYGVSVPKHQVTLATDHSIHLMNEELGIDFAKLMSSGILIPKLATVCSFPKGEVYFESYPYLKDDLPAPWYQVMTRLIREGITTEWESASPLVALTKAGKFHPELHQFYRGNVYPYGSVINATEYSKILNEKSLSLGVSFIESSTLEVVISFDKQHVSALHLDNDLSLQDAFFIDMTPERSLIDIIDGQDIANAGQNELGYINHPWRGNCLAMGDAAIRFISKPEPVNAFDWLFKALVRFVDFFPSSARQMALSREYNRLQKNDGMAILDFISVYRFLYQGIANAALPENLQHSVNLFAESGQLSEDAAGWAYPTYWPALLYTAGKSPQHVPRRVQEIPLSYLKNWYSQRVHNIDHLLSRSHNL
jgi:hypothetical protein